MICEPKPRIGFASVGVSCEAREGFVKVDAADFLRPIMRSLISLYLGFTRRVFEANYTLCLIAIAIDLSVNYFVKRSHILIHKELYLTTNRGSVYTFVII
ncbi:hypothetical protein [Nostoc sp. NZL]|uniref:hypothetical protein n=1 Tax=Nostoc sp. NZL TaxID=2650612 RepID=UPI0018C666AF|nr:hypothetical protein [Nostoc sp. NZL]MBG1242517.1 hypothetical protein [Nostoc sp. NZL]